MSCITESHGPYLLSENYVLSKLFPELLYNFAIQTKDVSGLLVQYLSLPVSLFLFFSLFHDETNELKQWVKFHSFRD